jgi:hypothetical protein
VLTTSLDVLEEKLKNLGEQLGIALDESKRAGRF